jgi:hypothetical protein
MHNVSSVDSVDNLHLAVIFLAKPCRSRLIASYHR